MRRKWVAAAILAVATGLLFWRWSPWPLAAARLSPATITTASRGLAITGDGARLLVANPDSNTVTLVDTQSLGPLAEIAVGVTPRAVALNGDFAYVANEGSDTLSLIDLRRPAVVTTIPVGDRPVAVAVAPGGELLAVAELGADQIRFLAAGSLTTIAIQPVYDRPYRFTFTADGRYLLTSHLLDGRVSRVTVPTGRSGPSAEPPVVTVTTWPNVAPAPGVTINSAGSRAYLPQTMANGLGLNNQFDTTVFPKVTVLNLATWSHRPAEDISLPDTDRPVGLPWDVALARDDSELWVVNAASNDLSVIDISNPLVPRRRAHIAVADNPRDIVVSPDGGRVYVNNTLAGTVTVIDADTYTVSAVIPVTDIPLPPLLLAGKRLFFSSSRPEVAQAAWISCNTCHVEGEHDGRTWQLQFLGEVPPGATPLLTRNTTSLLGMIETYPLRWSAEWNEAADSEFSIRFEQFGAGLIDGAMHPPLGTPNQGRSDELDALAAYLDSLAVPVRVHPLSAAAQRGQVIFESPQTGCAACHPAPLYTNWGRFDVGTATLDNEWLGPAFDTPSLRFLYDSAPYLHDGGAPTLRALLTTHNPADAHGVTSHLDEQALSDLIAFLLSLPYQ